MKMNNENITNLNSCLNFKHDKDKTINSIINSIVKNDVEFEIVDPENLNDVEFLKTLNLICHMKFFMSEIHVDDEFVVDELNKRFNNNLNNLIKLLIDPEIQFDDEFDVDDEIQIKNLYINNTLLLYEFVKYYDEFKNDYYENFYDELIDYIYIYQHDDDEIHDEIDELFQISEKLTNYVNYDDIIDDLIIDDFYYEIEFENENYLINNSYY